MPTRVSKEDEAFTMFMDNLDDLDRSIDDFDGSGPGWDEYVPLLKEYLEDGSVSDDSEIIRPEEDAVVVTDRPVVGSVLKKSRFLAQKYADEGRKPVPVPVRLHEFNGRRIYNVLDEQNMATIVRARPRFDSVRMYVVERVDEMPREMVDLKDVYKAYMETVSSRVRRSIT